MAPDRKALAEAGRKKLEEFRKAKAAGKTNATSPDAKGSPDAVRPDSASSTPAPVPLSFTSTPTAAPTNGHYVHSAPASTPVPTVPPPASPHVTHYADKNGAPVSGNGGATSTGAAPTAYSTPVFTIANGAIPFFSGSTPTQPAGMPAPPPAPSAATTAPTPEVYISIPATSSAASTPWTQPPSAPWTQLQPEPWAQPTPPSPQTQLPPESMPSLGVAWTTAQSPPNTPLTAASTWSFVNSTSPIFKSTTSQGGAATAVDEDFASPRQVTVGGAISSLQNAASPAITMTNGTSTYDTMNHSAVNQQEVFSSFSFESSSPAETAKTTAASTNDSNLGQREVHKEASCTPNAWPSQLGSVNFSQPTVSQQDGDAALKGYAMHDNFNQHGGDGEGNGSFASAPVLAVPSFEQSSAPAPPPAGAAAPAPSTAMDTATTASANGSSTGPTPPTSSWWSTNHPTTQPPKLPAPAVPAVSTWRPATAAAAPHPHGYYVWSNQSTVAAEATSASGGGGSVIQPAHADVSTPLSTSLTHNASQPSSHAETHSGSVATQPGSPTAGTAPTTTSALPDTSAVTARGYSALSDQYLLNHPITPLQQGVLDQAAVVPPATASTATSSFQPAQTAVPPLPWQSAAASNDEKAGTDSYSGYSTHGAASSVPVPYANQGAVQSQAVSSQAGVNTVSASRVGLSSYGGAQNQLYSNTTGYNTADSNQYSSVVPGLNVMASTDPYVSSFDSYNAPMQDTNSTPPGLHGTSKMSATPSWSSTPAPDAAWKSTSHIDLTQPLGQSEPPTPPWALPQPANAQPAPPPWMLPPPPFPVTEPQQVAQPAVGSSSVVPPPHAIAPISISGAADAVPSQRQDKGAGFENGSGGEMSLADAFASFVKDNDDAHAAKIPTPTGNEDKVKKRGAFAWLLGTPKSKPETPKMQPAPAASNGTQHSTDTQSAYSTHVPTETFQPRSWSSSPPTAVPPPQSAYQTDNTYSTSYSPAAGNGVSATEAATKATSPALAQLQASYPSNTSIATDLWSAPQQSFSADPPSASTSSAWQPYSSQLPRSTSYNSITQQAYQSPPASTAAPWEMPAFPAPNALPSQPVPALLSIPAGSEPPRSALDGSTAPTSPLSNHPPPSKSPDITLSAPYSLSKYNEPTAHHSGATSSFLESYLDNLLNVEVPPKPTGPDSVDGHAADGQDLADTAGGHASEPASAWPHGHALHPGHHQPQPSFMSDMDGPSAMHTRAPSHISLDSDMMMGPARSTIGARSHMGGNGRPPLHPGAHEGVPRVASQGQFSVLQQHIDELTEERLDLQRGLGAALKAQSALGEENEQLVERINTQGKTIEQLNKKLERYELELNAQVLAVEGMAAEREAARATQHEALERAKTLAGEVVTLESNLLNAKSSALKLQRDVDQLKEQVSRLEKQLNSARKEHASANEDVGRLTMEKRSLFVRLKQTESRLNKLLDESGVSQRAREALLSGLSPVKAETIEEGVQCSLVDFAQIQALQVELELAVAATSAARTDAAAARDSAHEADEKLRDAVSELGALREQHQQHQVEKLSSRRWSSVLPALAQPYWDGQPRQLAHPGGANDSAHPDADGAGKALWPVRDPPSAIIADKALSALPPAVLAALNAAKGVPTAFVGPLADLGRWLPVGPVSGSNPAGAIVEEHFRAATQIHNLLGHFEDEYEAVVGELEELSVENTTLHTANDELRRALELATQRLELSLSQSAGMAATLHTTGSAASQHLGIHNPSGQDSPGGSLYSADHAYNTHTIYAGPEGQGTLPAPDPRSPLPKPALAGQGGPDAYTNYVGTSGIQGKGSARQGLTGRQDFTPLQHMGLVQEDSGELVPGQRPGGSGWLGFLFSRKARPKKRVRNALL